MTDDGLPFCVECGDFFREDDTGGYNPECRCGYETTRPTRDAQQAGASLSPPEQEKP
jgi:hypothetical protein